MSGTTEKKVVQQPTSWSDPDREFVGMLAHELRNGLNSIRLLGVAAELDPENNPWPAVADVIDRLSPLLQDMLEFCRLTHGSFRLNCQRVDLREVGRRAAHPGRCTQFKRYGIQFDLNLPDDPVWTLCDSDRLTMACENLLDNALKNSAPAGVVRLGVSENANDAIISVSDTGLGINPALLNTLFQAFTGGSRMPGEDQGDISARGMGLGLLFVRTIAEAHGGRASARSHGPGLGSEFMVTLPRYAMGEGVPLGTVL